MRRGVSLKGAILDAQAESREKVKPLGFEERYIGDVIVNTFYYSYEWKMDNLGGTAYRWQMYFNGVKASGGVIDGG